jgi:dihydroneopterin aldolase
VVEVAPHDAARSDDVDKILSYDTLTEAIATELAGERLNLLETLAERIAQRVLRQPQALRCFVRIEKLDRGPGALGVEIVRSQNVADNISSDSSTRPLVVYLSNAALAAPHLTAWIDDLSGRVPPPVLCVDLPDGVTPRAGSALAQRRVDLLAIEQNAWILAARDRRCIVVGTRTELDWALKHGQLTVWAPSKIVLDSIERPPVGVSHGPALAAWFAARIGATALVVVGEMPPDPGEVAILGHGVNDPALPTP